MYKPDKDIKSTDNITDDRNDSPNEIHYRYWVKVVLACGLLCTFLTFPLDIDYTTNDADKDNEYSETIPNDSNVVIDDILDGCRYG